MKKITRIAALLAAVALLFGAFGCSSGGGGSGGGDDDVTEDTVKGTYTMSGGDLASGESNTLVVVGGKIYTKVDYSLDEEEEGESSGGSSAPGSTTQSDVTYTLTYVNGETAHEPSYTFDEVSDEEFGAALEEAQGDTFYIEVGTYEIANGRVTGRMIDNKGSYPARAETDDAGHLKSFTVSRSGEEPDEGGEGGDATFTFLKDINGGSSTAAAAAGFFSGTKTGDLDITVGDIELQLYKNNGGWTKIDASASSTKNESGASKSAGNVEGVTSIQGQFATKNDAIMHEDNTIFTGSGTGYEIGRVKITVTTKASAVALKKISGYFASGKSFTAGYVRAGDNDYAQITGTTAFSNNKGFKVDGFEVNQTIPANSTKDVYILLGKNAAQPTTSPAGATIDVAEVVYEFAAANSDSTNPNPDGDGEGDKSDDNEGEEPGDPTNPSNPDEEEEDKESVLVASITVTVDKTELEAGEKATFTAVCKGADGAVPSNGEVTWSAKIGDAPAANVITTAGVFTAPVHTDEDKTYTIIATAKDGSGTTGTMAITVKMQEPPTVGVKLDADFTTFSAAKVCAEGSTVPVRLGDTDFFAVSGSGGKDIELKSQNGSMALNFSGGGGIGKSAVFFYAKEGTATVTVTYYSGNADRYVKVLNEGMDTAEATAAEKTTTDKALKTRTINITVDKDLTPVYIGSASSGIYVASIKVEYTDE